MFIIIINKNRTRSLVNKVQKQTMVVEVPTKKEIEEIEAAQYSFTEAGALV